MTQNKLQNEINDQSLSKRFSNFSIGIFFMVSSLSIVILIFMFLWVWQPIWSDGFKDFHTISNAIEKLDKTAKPATDSIPTMLNEMTKMNRTMKEMVVIMKNMDESVAVIGEMTPAIKRMTLQIDRMSYVLGRIDSKLPATNRIPFWSN